MISRSEEQLGPLLNLNAKTGAGALHPFFRFFHGRVTGSYHQSSVVGAARLVKTSSGGMR